MNLYKELSEKRKEGQESGDIPMWYSTAGFQLFSEKYLYEAKTIKGQFRRIAKTASQYIKHIKEYKNSEEEFFNLLWNGWLSPSTPVLANMGTDRGLPVSCSGNYTSDSIEGFYESRKENALLTKYGFGTSSYLGAIRPRGSNISKGGKASGVLPVLKGFIQDSKDVSQGGVRRGSWAGYIEITHDDFDEICDFVLNEPDNCNIGWIITDDFINELNNGNEEYIKRYQKVLKTKMVTGRGYFTFIDKINRNRPDCYKNNELIIKASNLCVTGDQRVVTSRGLLTVRELYDLNEDLTLFDGDISVSSSPMQLIEKDADIFRINLDNGLFHDVTSYHKVKTDGGMIECKNLSIGQKVAFQLNKGLFGDKSMEDEAFLLGMYQSDGTQTAKDIMIDVWENDFDLIDEIQERFNRIHYKYECDTYKIKGIDGNVECEITRLRKPAQFRECMVNQSLIKKQRLTSRTFKKALDFQKGFVPQWIWESDEKTQWQYIRGLFYADRTVNQSDRPLKGSPVYLSLTSINKEFLLELQLLLLNLGVKFSLHTLREAGTALLPDGKGSHKYYNTKKAWRLVCGSKKHALIFEDNTGFLTRKNCHIERREYRDNTKKYSKVKSIEYIGKQDVYCTTINSHEHVWVCNGFITSNCSEITLFSDENHTFSCVLSSMNVSKYDEWKDTDAVYWATIFLDCVAEDLIQKGKEIKGIENVVRFTEKSRALGLGQCGFHTYLQQNNIPFESLESSFLNREIAKYIWDNSLKASKQMAILLGEPEWCKGYGIRNSHLIAIAPTKSSALLMGGISESISPDPAMAFTQTSAGGEMDRINPVLLKLMKERGVFNKKTITDIKAKMGSVQDVIWLSEDEKKVFKTAFEINQEVIIRLASQRAKYIDQWQSLNLFFSADENEEWISKIHRLAFEDENVLGLYYIYSQAGIQSSKDCESCM